jgi:hypothetical protein
VQGVQELPQYLIAIQSELVVEIGGIEVCGLIGKIQVHLLPLELIPRIQFG